MHKPVSKRRRECRLNLRFWDPAFFDALEIHAHSKGLTLAAWARSILMKELNSAEEDKIITEKLTKVGLMTFKLLERLSSPEDVSDARRVTDLYIEGVRQHVRNTSD